jgi:hypothetical protein
MIIMQNLNEAILKVITTKYKKDAEDAHSIVKAAGYEVYKSDGCYVVRNDKTGKAISGLWHITCHNNLTSHKWNTHRRIKERCVRHKTKDMNLVAYLNTPWNQEWSKVCEYHTYNGGYGGAIHDKFYNYIKLKIDAQYYEEEAERIRKQIAEATERLEECIRRDVKAKQEFENYLKEKGLR